MKNLYKSLAGFQQEIKPIFKGTSGYGYKYADWTEILQQVNPLMAKHGLGFTQLLDGQSLKTVVFHVESGESIEGSVAIPQGVALKGMNDFQVLGSAITYLRRYSLSSALGLVTDEDADAAGEQPKQPKKTVDNLPKLKQDIYKLFQDQGTTTTDGMELTLLEVLNKTSINSVDEAKKVIKHLKEV